MEVVVDVNVPDEVTLKPFRVNGHMEKGHDGELRFSKTFEALTVQLDRSTNLINTGLTPAEELTLEKQMNLPGGSLSKYNRDWWGKFLINVPAKGIILHPRSNPMDFIKWKVAMVHQEVAKSEAQKAFTPFANYVLTSIEEENRESLKGVEKKSAAFAKFNNMSVKEMKDFLRVYGKATDVNESSGEEFVKAKTGRVVEENPELFLTIMNDKTFKMRVFINRCIEKNLIINQATKYSLVGGDIIGYSLDKTVDYLSDKENQEVYITLKGQLDASK